MTIVLRTGAIQAVLLAALACSACTRPPTEPGASPATSSRMGALLVAQFSSAPPGDELPPGWTPLTFPSMARHTRYTLVTEPGGSVLRADADASASGLLREIDIDPATHPVIEWRWRVLNVLAGSDIRSRAGDDYPARLYITFAHDESSITFADRVAQSLTGRMPPRAALNYVWDTRAPAGTVLPNAYTDRVRMIVVESGETRVGQWVTYRRNIAEDFRRAFGYAPPPVSGIAVMTDTDNTGERATAFYGDILMLPAR